MKVSSEAKFKPIMIVLETEAEAICLWHRLNIGSAYLEDYAKGIRVSMKDIDERADLLEMWRLLNKEIEKQGIRILKILEEK